MVDKDKKINKNARQERTFEAEIRKVDEETRSIELSFSSETPVYRWYGTEILSHDTEAVDLERLKEVGVVLFSHGRDVNYGRMPIAKIEDAWLDPSDRKLRAKITFDDDEDSERVYQKVKKGYIKGVSFGYSVSSWEEVAPGKKSVNGRFDGPASIGIRWEPFEISIEPTPADPAVGVGRSAEEDEPEKQEEKENEQLREQQEHFWKLRKKLNNL